MRCRRRDERSSERRERGSPRGPEGTDDCVARGSQSGGESTNEETNVLRSKEHACSNARENVVKRKQDEDG